MGAETEAREEAWRQGLTEAPRTHRAGEWATEECAMALKCNVPCWVSNLLGTGDPSITSNFSFLEGIG